MRPLLDEPAISLPRARARGAGHRGAHQLRRLRRHARDARRDRRARRALSSDSSRRSRSSRRSGTSSAATREASRPPGRRRGAARARRPGAATCSRSRSSSRRTAGRSSASRSRHGARRALARASTSPSPTPGSAGFRPRSATAAARLRALSYIGTGSDASTPPSFTFSHRAEREARRVGDRLRLLLRVASAFFSALS